MPRPYPDERLDFPDALPIFEMGALYERKRLMEATKRTGTGAGYHHVVRSFSCVCEGDPEPAGTMDRLRTPGHGNGADLR